MEMKSTNPEGEGKGSAFHFVLPPEKGFNGTNAKQQ
jgi:hypothetical protein